MHVKDISALRASSQLVSVSAISRPFSMEPSLLVVSEGATVADILAEAVPDPFLHRFAVITIEGAEVSPHYYHRIKPKAGKSVAIRIVPKQGGGGGSKILRAVLTIAVIAIAVVFQQYYAVGLAGTLGITSSAGVAAFTAGGVAAITIGGSLLVNALVPIRPPALANGTANSSPTFFIEGARNQIRPFNVVPTVLGRHKQVPPYGAKPFTEAMGADQYVRCLFVWGVGPLLIEDIKIGDTPIGQFEEVEIETRQGFPTDAPLTLFTQDVEQEDLSIQLTQANDWITRSTAADADEIGVDISFPGGLFIVTPDGDRHARRVLVQIQYRKLGTAPWLDFPGNASMSFPQLRTPPTVEFFQNTTSPIRHGIRWRVSERAQYEIRIRRSSPDQPTDAGGGSVEQADQIVDQSWWTAIRRFTNENPINSDVPLAMTALRIKATDQLNNVVDELNGICTSIAPDWDGSAWVTRATRNPASLFRLVLQGSGISETLPDSRVDLDGIEEFHEFCSSEGFTFDMVRDFESSVWSCLADICAAARSSPTQRDGKWSVVTDRPQTIPVQHFTPRNSWGFTADKAFVDMPHGFRVRFINEDQGYVSDERIVYDDGFTVANATRFEQLELPGVTDPDNIFKLARFHIAQARLRPERWTLNADIEHIVARRGSLVKVTHDTLLVGLAAGRVTNLVENTEGDIAGIVVDEALPMDAGVDYGISIRTPGDPAVVAQVVTDPGEQTEISFTTPIPAASAPSVGDLFGFGQLGLETVEALVLSIEPMSDFKARLLLVPYQEDVYEADQGTIPPFETGITPLPSLSAPVVLSVRSDESALARVGNTLEVRIEVELRPLPPSLLAAGAGLDVQVRPTETGEPYQPADIASLRQNGVTLRGVREGQTIDIRLRWRLQDRLPGAWTTIPNHRVVGKSTPPFAPQGLTISIHGGSALLRWNPPSELDVRFGGTIKFRHSPAFTGATWAGSTSIGASANSTALVAVLPLKPGTYLARTFDGSGNPSVAVSFVTTKQAAVLEFANVDTVTEDPDFVGTHTDTVESGGILKLDSQGDLDAIADFDDVDNLDAFGGIVSEGIYDFAAGFDLATTDDITPQRVRLTTNIVAISVSEVDLIDVRAALMDTWEDFDGDTQGAADCEVWVRQTDDDPAATAPDWSTWERLDSGEFEARGFEFQARLSTEDPAFNINVSELSVVAERLAA